MARRGTSSNEARRGRREEDEQAEAINREASLEETSVALEAWKRQIESHVASLQSELAELQSRLNQAPRQAVTTVNRRFHLLAKRLTLLAEASITDFVTPTSLVRSIHIAYLCFLVIFYSDFCFFLDA